MGGKHFEEKKTFAQFSVLSGRMEVAEDNLGTSDLLEFAIYLPALSLDFLYSFLLNNCNSLASFSFRISIVKVPVFSSHPCLRVSICSMILFPIFVFFCIREENPVIFVHQLTYLLHRLFKYTGWFSLGRAIGNVNQNWSNKIWPIEKAMHLLRTFDAQAQRQLILFESLFTTTSTQKKKKKH